MVRRGVVCGGCWLVDHNNSVASWPEEETLASILSREIRGGGPAHNMAVDLARLGAGFPLWAMGVVGDDDAGRLLQGICDRYGIDRSRLRVIDGVCTSHTDVMTVRATGRRTFFHHQGANALLSPSDFDFRDLSARILHLGAPGIHQTMDGSGDMAGNGWVQVLQCARAAGISTNLEMVSGEADAMRRLAAPCLPYLDSLIINDFEAGALAGLDVVSGGRTSIAAARKAAKVLMEQGPMAVVVIHFPAGCVAVARGGEIIAKPSLNVPAEAIRGANGAGDAFAAGVLLGLHEKWSLEESLRLGLCSAASALRSVSTTESVGSIQECLALEQEWGWRPQV